MESTEIINILRKSSILSLILESLENDLRQEMLINKSLSKNQQVLLENLLENLAIMKNFLDILWLEIFEQIGVLDESLSFERVEFLDVEIPNEKFIEKFNIENNTFDLIKVNFVSEHSSLLKLKEHFQSLIFYFRSSNSKNLNKLIQLNYGLTLLDELIAIFQKFIQLKD